jgi:murein DD-endopeptidase MepM/ murein hydrolase activator NlpD
MKHEDFLYGMTNPAPDVSLDVYPNGSVYQTWGDSPELYSAAFGHNDDLHKYTEGHSGIDIVGAHRTPLVAAHDGTVKAIKTDRASLGGLCLWIDSPPLDFNGMGDSKITTGYGHLDEIVVREGEWVNKGQPIGFMGNTGFVVSGGTPYWGNAPAGKGTHLHFSLYEYVFKNGSLQPRFHNFMQNSSDPLSYLTRNPVGLVTVLKNVLALIAFWQKK